MTFESLLTNLRHASTNWKANKNKNHVNLVVVCSCYCNVHCYSSE